MSEIQPLSEVEPFDYVAQDSGDAPNEPPSQPQGSAMDIGTYIEIGRAYNRERERSGNADLDFNEFKAQYIRDNADICAATGDTDLAPGSPSDEIDGFFFGTGTDDDDFLSYQRSVMESDDEKWRSRYLAMQEEMAEQRKNVNRRRMHGNPFLHEERALNIDLDRELARCEARMNELRKYREAARYFNREPEFDENAYLEEKERDYPW